MAHFSVKFMAEPMAWGTYHPLVASCLAALAKEASLQRMKWGRERTNGNDEGEQRNLMMQPVLSHALDAARHWHLFAYFLGVPRRLQGGKKQGCLRQELTTVSRRVCSQSHLPSMTCSSNHC